MKPYICLLLLCWGMPVVAEFKPVDPTPYVTDVLNVIGPVKTPLTLSVAELHALPAHTLKDVSLTCLTGSDKGTVKSYRGVLLRDVIDRADISALGKSDLKQLLIFAIASDNYRAVFTWNEVFNTNVGDGILVLYEKDRSPLTAEEGHIALISSCDLHTGPRHVKWLKTIELRKLTDM